MRMVQRSKERVQPKTTKRGLILKMDVETPRCI
jgi:hypothetical protein